MVTPNAKRKRRSIDLTKDLVVKNLTSPDKTFTDFRDGDRRGFYVRVRKGGKKRWFYRYRQGNRFYRYWIGPYPKISCADAFAEYTRLSELVSDYGRNPVAEEKDAAAAEEAAEAAEAQKLSLATLFDEHYVPEYAKVKKRSWREDVSLFDRHLRTPLGADKAENITKQEITALIRGIEGRGHLTTARQVLALIRKVYNWALSDGIELIEGANPATYKLQQRPKTDDRILTDDEIKLLWPALGETNPDRAIKLLLLTGARSGEVARLHHREIDRSAREWLLPAERSKNKRAHVVPLTDRMWRLIASGDTDGYVFKSHGRAGCLHPTSINHRLTQLCAELQITGVHPHTLRKTVNSQMAKLGIPLDIRQRVLNHTPQDVTSRHYDLHDYLREKRRALETWEGVLMRIAGQQPAAKVVSIIRT